LKFWAQLKGVLKLRSFFVALLLFIFHPSVWAGADDSIVVTHASRAPFEGSLWKPFKEAEKIGVRMLIDDQILPGKSSSTYSFSVTGKTIQDHYIYAKPNDKDNVLTVFTKPQKQTIQQAIKKQFIDILSGPGKETCIVAKRLKSPAGRERFDITPNPARKSQLDKEAHGDIPDYRECGRYSDDPDSEQYFEYQPINTTVRFMFVSVGQDTPYFDQDSIELFDPSQAEEQTGKSTGH